MKNMFTGNAEKTGYLMHFKPKTRKYAHNAVAILLTMVLAVWQTPAAAFAAPTSDDARADVATLQTQATDDADKETVVKTAEAKDEAASDPVEEPEPEASAEPAQPEEPAVVEETPAEEPTVEPAEEATEETPAATETPTEQADGDGNEEVASDPSAEAEEVEGADEPASEEEEPDENADEEADDEEEPDTEKFYLNDLVKTVNVEGDYTTNDNDDLVVTAGTTYAVDITFKETAKEDGQLPEADSERPIIYTIPAVYNVPADKKNDLAVVLPKAGPNNEDVKVKAAFKFGKKNPRELQIIIDQDDPYASRILDADKASFVLHLEGEFVSECNLKDFAGKKSEDFDRIDRVVVFAQPEEEAVEEEEEPDSPETTDGDTVATEGNVAGESSVGLASRPLANLNSLLGAKLLLASALSDGEADIVDFASVTVTASSSTKGLSRTEGSLEVKVDFASSDNSKIAELYRNGLLTWVYDLSDLVEEDGYFVDRVTGEGGDLRDSDGSLAGSWVVENNKVVFNVSESWLETHQSGLAGYFTLVVSFSEEELGNNTATTLAFPGGSTIQVSFEDKYTLTKQCELDWGSRTVYTDDSSIDPTAYPIPYHITLSSKSSDLQEMVVKDTLSEGEYVSSSFKLTVNDEEYSDFEEFLVFTDAEAPSFSFLVAEYLDNLGITVDEDTTIALDYTATVDLQNFVNNQHSVTNAANYEVKDGSPAKPSTTSTELEYIDKPRYVAKESVVTGEGAQSEYTYTVTFGADYADTKKPAHMSGQTISDKINVSYERQISADDTLCLKLQSDVVLVDSEGNTYILYSKNGEVDKSLGQYFELLSSTAGSEPTTLFAFSPDDYFDEEYGELGPFEIRYTMGLDASAYFQGTVTVNNKVSESGPLGSASATKIDNGKIGVLGWSKNLSDYNEDGSITWALTVEVEKGRTLKDVLLTELECHILGKNEFGYYDTSIVRGLFEFLWDRTYVTDENGKVLDDLNFEIRESQDSIHFDELDQTVVVYLTAMPPFSLVDDDRIENIAGFTIPGYIPWNVKSEDDYKSSDYTLSKDVSYDKATGLYTWMIDINHFKVPFSPDFDVIFEDLLPDGMELVNAKNGDLEYNLYIDYEDRNRRTFTFNTIDEYAKAMKEGYPLWSGMAKADSSKGKIGPINLSNDLLQSWDKGPSISENHIKIYYQTKPTDDLKARAAANGGHVDLTNVAYTYDEDNPSTTKKTTTATTAYESEVLSKHDLTEPLVNATDVDGRALYFIDYRVDVNSEGIALNGGQSITLIDDLSESFVLDRESVKAINQNGEDVAERVSYDSSTNKLQIVLPDKTPISVTYRLQVLDLDKGNYSNKVTLHGQYDFTDEVSKKHKFVDSGAGVKGTKPTIQLLKIDQDDIQRNLSGGKFELTTYWMDSDTGADWVQNAVSEDEVRATTQESVDKAIKEAKERDSSIVDVASNIDVISWPSDSGISASVSYSINYLHQNTDEELYTASELEETLGKVNLTGTENYAVTYSWREVEAPEGYVIHDDSEHYFSVYDPGAEQGSANTKKKAEEGAAALAEFDYFKGASIDVRSDNYTWLVTNERTTLTLKKDVVGSNVDLSKSFIFSVALTDSDGKPVSGTFNTTDQDGYAGSITFDNGTASAVLSAGGSLIIHGMLVGYHYSVTEADYESVGYRNRSGVVSGDIKAGEDAVAAITNAKKTKETVEHGSATVSKVDQKGSPLSGAQFTLFADNNCTTAITSYSSGDDGKLSISTQDAAFTGYLPEAGKTATFYLKETAAPAGCELSDDIHYVRIKNTVNPEILRDGYYVTNASYSVTVDSRPEVSIVNHRSASASLILKGKKTLQGATLESGQFTFQVLNEDKQVVAEATNDKDGNYSIELKYTNSEDDLGLHRYTVVEKAGTDETVFYDSSEYTVDVTVSDNGSDTLEIQKSDNYQELDFVNYAPVGSVTFEGAKHMKGRDLLASDIYDFAIYEGENLVDTVTNDSTGKILYPEISYTLKDVGEHVYTVKETSASNVKVDTDSNVYTVRVMVSYANGDDELTVAASKNSTSLDFTNTYKAYGSIAFEGTKSMTGRYLTSDDVYTFAIYEGDNLVGTATNDATGKIAYPTIEYTTVEDCGTHTYTVREVSEGGKGVTVDDREYQVDVNVSDSGNGVLSVTSSENASKLNFTNTYEAKGTANLEVTKSFNKTLEGGDFTFELKNASDEVLKTATNDEDGKVAFEIKYTQSDVANSPITYTISEVKGDKGGITYDASSCEVEVTLVDDGKGNITATPSYDGKASKTFTNTYAATGDITFKGTKTLSGRTLADSEFSFVLKDASEKEIETVSNDANGSFSFSKIRYTLDEVGEHTYTVSEVVPEKALPGVTYDATVYDITVKVEDKGDGTLDVTATGVDDVTKLAFSNEYKSAGDVSLSVNKELTGRTLKAGEFSFELKDASGAVLQTKTNAADGTVTFDKISYTQDNFAEGETEKGYIYTVKEVKGDKDSIDYSTATCIITVTLTDDGKGNITATPAYQNQKFTNAYTSSGSVNLEVNKELAGRAMAAGEFSFDLKNASGEVLQTQQNDKDGKVAFEAIGYTQADVANSPIKYTISEEKGDKGGVTYDASECNVSVALTDNGEGNITATATYTDAEGEAFEGFKNTYTAEGSIAFSGKKTLDGRDMTDNDEFGFKLVRLDANGNADAEFEPLTATASKQSPAYSFAPIPYDQADAGKTYTYEVSEVVPDDAVDGKKDGITYASEPYTIKVEVKDNRDGTLTPKIVEGPEKDKVDFTNTYAATGKLELSGTKTLKGRDLKTGDKFNFQVLEGEGNDATVVSTGTSDETGAITFSDIEYTLNNVGPHTYTVEELASNVPGVTVSDKKYTLEVEVSDNGDGTLKAEVTSETAKNGLDFENTYEASGSITFVGKKSIDTRALTASDTFTFEIYENGKLIKSAQNDASGKIDYPTITYVLKDVGTHTYTVKETAVDAKGVKSKDTEHKVTVKVTDNTDGTLEVVPSANFESLDFVNAYTASGSLELEGTKTLTGRDLAKDDVFTFSVTDDSGKEVSTGVSDETGKITFTPISYSIADAGKTYTYTVAENASNIAGVTDSGKTYTITATVSDNTDGTLKVETAGDSPKALDFENTYDAKGEIVFSGEKTLNGRDLAEGEFSFELKQGSETLQTVPNTEGGSYAFEKIEYGLSDVGKTYTYTVNEVIPADADKLGGVEYATNSYEITVEVSDNGNGTLEAKVTSETAENELDFTNTYTATGEITLSGTKAFSGRELTDDDAFTFNLVEVDKEGATVTDGTSFTATATKGSLDYRFDAIEYDLGDVGTHYYQVTEANGGETIDGITYDDAKHTVQVEVSDKGDGTLDAHTVGETAKDALDFTNTYTATGSIALAGTKALKVPAGEESNASKEGFTFQLTANGEAPLKVAGEEAGAYETPESVSATSDAEGNYELPALQYTLDDVDKTYSYTLQEVKVDSTYAALTEPRTVEVTIRDNGDGTLEVTATPENGSYAFTNAYLGETEVSITKVWGDNDDAKNLRPESLDVTLMAQSGEGSAAVAKAIDGADVPAVSLTADGKWTATVDSLPKYDADGNQITYTWEEGEMPAGYRLVDTQVEGAATTLTNALAIADLSFKKFYYGENPGQTFTFNLVATDENRQPLSDGDPDARSFTAQNGAYEGTDGPATVKFEDITFPADGTYYFLASEAEPDDANVVADEAQYFVTIEVKDGLAGEPEYYLVYPDDEGEMLQASDPDDDPAFYNNDEKSVFEMGFSSMSNTVYENGASVVSVYPEVKKYLNGSTDMLAGGDFSFRLLDADGNLVAEQVNDATGNVAFFEQNGTGLVFDEPGIYTYTIEEVTSGVSSDIECDTSAITYTVVVAASDTADDTEATTLTATATYTKDGQDVTDAPAFYNTQEGMNLEVYKVSRSGGEGLADCTYALWMASDAGDVMLQEATSDSTGLIVFQDVVLSQAHKYYFKEVEAPDGHTVDPYRTAYFSLNSTGDGTVLVEDTAADGWHSKYDK